MPTIASIELFNLLVCLRSSLFFVVQNWCGTDRIVLIKTIRMLFKRLFEDQGGSPDLVGSKQTIAIANGRWEAKCIDYAVSWHLYIIKISSSPDRRSFLHSLFCYLRKVEKSFVEFYPIGDSCSIKRFALLLQLLKSNGRSLNANLRFSSLSQIMKTETCGIFNDSFTNLYLQVCEYSSFYTTCRHNTLWLQKF